MHAGARHIGLSIVIEWENASRIGSARAERMLAALRHQLAEPPVAMAGPAEIVILHPAAQPAPQVLTDAARAFDATGTPCRLVPTEIADYYRQKNAGAGIARGELLVFLDSDVVPRDDWLAGLLDAMRDPAVALVGGATTIDRDGWYASALALIWIFPLPRPALCTQPSSFFYANNFIVRRRVFVEHPFPDTGQYRGQCSALAEAMIREGLVLRMNHAALVGHPPPSPRDLLPRAWRSGSDLHHWLAAGDGPAVMRRGMQIVAHDVLVAFRRVHADRRSIGMDVAGAVGALALAAAYNITRALGFCVARLVRG